MLSVHLVSLVRPVADLPKLRPLLRISLSKFNLRRMIWFLINDSLWITSSPLSLDGYIIQMYALMLRKCFIVVELCGLCIRVHPGLVSSYIQ